MVGWPRVEFFRVIYASPDLLLIARWVVTAAKLFSLKLCHINCGVIMIFPRTSGESPAAVGKTVS